MKFGKASTPRPAGRLLEADDHLGEGSTVRLAGGGSVRLGRPLGAGGEGAIFAVDDSTVCKIYHPDRRNERLRDKIAFMVGRRVEDPRLAWPTATALDGAGRFVGCLMPLMRGIPLQPTFFQKPLIERTLPGWNRRHFVRVARGAVDIVTLLHGQGAIVGDLNPCNFLVREGGVVSLIDCDSLQIEDFGCPVGQEPFTRPERQGIPYDRYLRDVDDDLFALATLLFLILMPGKAPYCCKDGEGPRENILKRAFPYPIGGKRAMNVPEGPWLFNWSHFPGELKAAFHAVFAEGKRVTLERWVKTLDGYARALEAGKEKDALFFEHYRIWDEVRVACDECGRATPMERRRVAQARAKGWRLCCPACVRAHKRRRVAEEAAAGGAEMVRCAHCGQTFRMSRAKIEQNVRFGYAHLCFACFDKECVKRMCANCGTPFYAKREKAEALAASGIRPLCRKCRPGAVRNGGGPANANVMPENRENREPPSLVSLLKSFFG